MRLPAANVFALLTGALIWGLVWYPYRVLRADGLAAAWATVFTYGFAWIVISVLFHRLVRAVRLTGILLWVGLAAGCANVGFLIAAIYGQVARVVLLFYIAPVWTVPLAWWLLGEAPSRRTLPATAIALLGAAVMLWNPALGLPWPPPLPPLLVRRARPRRAGRSAPTCRRARARRVSRSVRPAPESGDRLRSNR